MNIPPEGSCDPVCPDFYFENYSTFTCDPCDITCKGCDSAAFDDCYSCFNGTPPTYLFDTKCLAICPTSFYANTSNNKCAACHITCYNCDGPLNS